MDNDSLQDTIADEDSFKGETDESELQALVSKLKTNILIIGSGGAGNNTLLRLYKEGMTSIELLAVNTDAQHLLNTSIPHRMLIGKHLRRD
jgi:Cell division GTPase